LIGFFSKEKNYNDYDERLRMPLRTLGINADLTFDEYEYIRRLPYYNAT
jgi:hypothetical protein